jgi:peptidoglycan L-alanyl-D-glutamate endopeptidase CwlK
MDSQILVSLVVVLLPLSFIAERFSNFFKLILPSNGKLGFGNLRHKENDTKREKIRERKIFLLSLLSGEIVAFALKADLFRIIEDGKIGWNHQSDNLLWIVGCFFTGFFLSWGSKFWHDLLGILLEVKNLRKAYAEEKTVEVRKKTEAIQPTNDSDVEIVEKETIEKPKDLKLKEDAVSLKRIEKLHPSIRKEVTSIYKEILKRQVSIRFTDTLRTFPEQTALYAKGRTKSGKIVTNAKAGESYHNYGLALDFCLLLKGGKEVSWDRNKDTDADNKKDWDEVVAVFKHYGWQWGGDWTNFKDYPHFQKTFNLSTAELLKKHKSKDVDSNGYVNI